MTAAIVERVLPGMRGDIAALQGGTPGGPRLLCLHGWLDNAASFVPLFESLSAFEIVAIDLPGHGGSAHRAAGHDYAFVDWIHDALDALDALAWPSAHVLGHSLGGAIASALAAAMPERVERLALIEALGPLSGAPEDAGQRLRQAIQARRAPAGRSARVITRIDLAVAARLAATVMPADAARLIVERNLRAVDGGYLWRSDPRLNLPSAVRLPEASVQSILREISAPTLLIAADPAPPYFTAETRDARLGCLADITVEVMAGGHHLHMEQPEHVGGLIAGFLAALRNAEP